MVPVKVGYAVPFALFVVLAGCLGQSQDDLSLDDSTVENFMGEVPADRLPVPTGVDFTKAVVGEHQAPNLHGVRALHTGNYGLELVGFSDLLAPGDTRTAAFAAADLWGTYVAVVSLAGGVVIVDIADPAAPKVVSTAGSTMVSGDAQFTDDGKYLFAGCFAGNDQAGIPALSGTPVSLLADAGDCGVTVWDVEDKASPRMLFNSETGGYHNLFTATINGTYWLFKEGGAIQRFDPAGPTIETVNETMLNHDMTVSRNPIDGTWLLYSGSNEGGLIIYDIDDPAYPEIVGQWEPEDGEPGQAWHDQQPILGTVDGRAYLVGAGETGGGNQIPLVVLDVTDLNAITKVGEWIIPGKPENPPNEQGRVNFFTMGVHEYEVWNGYVALGHYHSGIWLLDVGSPERAANPVTLGYYIPDEVGTAAPFAFNPDVWGAYFDERGYVVATDVGSGLYVLKFAATAG